MKVKYKRISFLIFFIFVFSASLYVNIYFTEKKNLPTLSIFDINGIYFDFSLIENGEKANELKDYINSKNTAYYSNIILQKNNPEGQFYSFCGYLKSNQKSSIKYLENLLLSSTNVDIFINSNNKKRDYPLGFAVLLLIKEFPKDLTDPPNENFYKDIENILKVAYNSNLSNKNSEYKKELLSLISEKNATLFKELFKDKVVLKPAVEMTINEKIETSAILSSMDEFQKKEYIENFLKEDNERLIFNTLTSITENDSKDIADIILKMLYTKKSSEITKLLIEKYALLLKENSLYQIKSFMKVITDYQVITSCLEQIKKYGDNSNYDFLKTYLLQRFPDDINLLALEGIVETTYKTKPDDVINTMVFLLRKGKEVLAEYAIRFHMKNKLYINSQIILPRLKLRESENMDKLALEYINYFNLKAGGSLLLELAKSNNEEIQKKANDLIKKLDIKENDIDNTSDN